jgi:hypothetical protein
LMQLIIAAYLHTVWIVICVYVPYPSDRRSLIGVYFATHLPENRLINFT